MKPLQYVLNSKEIALWDISGDKFVGWHERNVIRKKVLIQAEKYGLRSAELVSSDGRLVEKLR